jgi:hypothetical protein
MEQQAKAMIAQLKGIFSGWPASLRTPEHEKNYGKEFMKALAQFKIVSSQQIKRGMVRARLEAEKGERYLPSGATFAGWCKPSAKEYGIDDFDSSYTHIRTRNWEALHPAFQHIATQTKEVKVVVRKLAGCKVEEKVQRKQKYDLPLLKTGKDYEVRKLAQKIFDEVVQRVSAGEHFDRIEAIEDQSSARNPNWSHSEKGQSVMNNLLRSVGSVKANG